MTDVTIEIINYRYEHEKPVICSSNSSRANLVKEQNYEERVVQRLMEMCPYQFEFNGDDVMRITRAKQKRDHHEQRTDRQKTFFHLKISFIIINNEKFALPLFQYSIYFPKNQQKF